MAPRGARTDPCLRSHAFASAALALTFACTASLLARHVADFGAAYTDDDQTIFWVGATEMARLSFAEPFFYGQAYNTLFEALIAAPFVALGVSPHVAVPIGATLVGLTPWVCLAVLALRRQQLWLALLAVGAPLLLPEKFSMVLTMARGFHTGLAFAAIGLTVTLWRTPLTNLRALVGASLLTLGVAATPNAALLAVPALFYLAATHLRRARLLAALVAGCALAFGLWRLGQAFYDWYPEYDLFPLSSTEWRASLVTHVLRNPDPFLGDVTPLLGARSELLLLAPAAALVATFRARAHAASATIALATLAVLASFGVVKVHDGGSSVYHPLLRMYLAVPFLLGWFALLATGHGAAPRVDKKDATAGLPRAALLALVLCLAFALSAHRRLGVQVPQLAREGSSAVLHREVAPLRAECARYAEHAKRAKASLIVFMDNRLAAYGCAALLAGEVETLLPDFERRTWRLFEEHDRRHERVLFASIAPDLCTQARRAGLGCQMLQPGLARVEPRGLTTLQTVHAVGGRVRRYHGRPYDERTGIGIPEGPGPR